MHKKVHILPIILLLCAAMASTAFAVATIGGTLVSVSPGSRQLVIRLKSGTQKTVQLSGNARAYKLNQSAMLSSFKPGEYVVVKLSNAINDEIWQADILMDNFSSAQYTAGKQVVPIQKPTGGGFMTSAGAASSNLPPVTGVYPNAISGQWPNNNTAPGVNWSTNQGGNMNANPAPWGSPVIGDVLAGNTGDNPGSPSWGSGGGAVNTGGGAVVHYDTGPAVPTAMNPDTNANITGAKETGLTPGQAQWVSNPTESAPTKRMVEIQGRVRQIDTGTMYMEDTTGSKTYVVTIRPTTKISDYLTEQPITQDMIQPGKVVMVSGVLSGEENLNALRIKVHR